jgi:hypothetical protein
MQHVQWSKVCLLKRPKGENKGTIIVYEHDGRILDTLSGIPFEQLKGFIDKHQVTTFENHEDCDLVVCEHFVFMKDNVQNISDRALEIFNKHKHNNNPQHSSKRKRNNVEN